MAHRDELGFELPIIKAQVKSTTSNIGAPDVQALYGNIGAKDEYGLFVTLGRFNNSARTFAHGKSNLRLIFGDELVDIILRHYDNFSSRYKGLIPLQNVYIPQSLDESND